MPFASMTEYTPMVPATPRATITCADAPRPASAMMPIATTTMPRTPSGVKESPSSRMPPTPASRAPPPRAIGYAREKSPTVYALASSTQYGMWTRPDIDAHTYPRGGMPPPTTNTTAGSQPAMKNWPHSAMKRSPTDCLTDRFQTACSTVAISAKTVAVSMSWSSVEGRAAVTWPIDMYDDMSRPIGMFDSGFGGLTVARAVIDLLPAENLVYVGDTGRYPYGPRDQDEVRGFAIEISRFLVDEHDVKMVVVACNTAAAAALDELQAMLDVPVV